MLHRNVNTGAQQRTEPSTDTNQQQRATSSTDTNQQQRATSSSSSSGNTQFYNIGVDLTTATTTYEPRVDYLRQEAADDKQQQEMRHQQELARIIQLANQELKEQEERLTKKRDDDVWEVLRAQAQRELDEWHEAQHDDGRLFRNKGTKGKQSEDDTGAGSRPQAKAKPTVIPKPPAPPPSIANVTPALPPPKAKPAAPPPPKAKPAAQPRRNAKPKQALALQDQGRPHHEEAPDSKTKKKLKYKQKV